MTRHRSGYSVFIALCLATANACGGAAAGVAHANDNPQVRYEVSGPGVAQFINYETDAGQLRAVNAPLPWSTQFTGFGGQVFVLSAQGVGNIRCRIVVDGNVVSDAQSGGGRTVCTH